MSFTTLGLAPALIKALIDQKFTIPTPIQEAAIPAIMEKKDVLGIAKRSVLCFLMQLRV